MVRSFPISSEEAVGSNLPIASGLAIITHEKLQHFC